MLRPPAFWQNPPAKPGILAYLLSPLSWLLAWLGRRNFWRKGGYHHHTPLICVGNMTIGGNGKTPVAIAVAQWFLARGRRPVFVTAGYPGRLSGPIRVDPQRHTHHQVGDEALLLACYGTVWIGRDRIATAQKAAKEGDILILDDGMQHHHSLCRDLVLLNIDTGKNLGNGRLIPAGPLRERPQHALAKSHALILIGAEKEAKPPLPIPSRMPVLSAKLRPCRQGISLNGVKILAFAGIATPGNFFTLLRKQGAILVEEISFSDHQTYSNLILMRLIRKAEKMNALLVTTQKDMIRIAPVFRSHIHCFVVEAKFTHPDSLDNLLNPILARCACPKSQ